uniref:Protein kinase domain-containing protein n=1 Tax=Romanomermis culicivorax TaxID=13658 RepID=A0A915LD84_ROMCU
MYNRYILLCGYPPFYGECSLSDCGWNNGQPCSDCQETLFNRIQVGHFEFPTDDWEDRSEQVKDLIRHLLTTDVNSRYTVDELLRHPFLAAASVVRRTNSGYNLLNPPGHLQDDYCIQQSLSGLKLSAGVAAEDLAARVVMSRPVWISVPSNCEQNP